MKHARQDYNRIQDPINLIPDDEPVFLIRGQDICGPDTLRVWAALATARGAESNIVETALKQADAMEQWQLMQSRPKVPDMP